MFGRKEKLDILRKTQENLEISQNNLDLVATMLGTKSSDDKLHTLPEHSQEDKLKAAYALNLCMVSVSQIVDYNDIYILEQEYDAILNNLNIEEMPKDEALLHILKQLLDTITFFRIQEGDKKMIEREYQQKMKNAIWSAVPNIGMLVAGGGILTMAVSLASQVGIGYMNYRKTRAQNALDKDKAMWQLQRSAMEQFNALRRELFDTTWRLADKYNFPDKYRITEKQVSLYNTILMDNNYLRRYERLMYIKGDFEAYSPFMYYLGNAANMVSQEESFDCETRSKYRSLAIEHYQHFIGQAAGKLLREDQLLASCALEYFDLLLELGCDDKTRLSSLIRIAIDAAGNAFDVLQICAFSYIKIEDYTNASAMLRILVNEKYNTITNAQFLSGIYVTRYLKEKNSDTYADYNTLCTRVSRDVLFPMPSEAECELYAIEDLQKTFFRSQRTRLLVKYADTVRQIITRYTIAFNQAIPAPNKMDKGESSYYLDTEDAASKRKRDILGKLAGDALPEEYLCMLDCLAENIIHVLGALYGLIKGVPGVENPDGLEGELINSISENSKTLSSLQEKIQAREFNGNDAEMLISLNFASFATNALKSLVYQIQSYILTLNNMSEYAKAESNLHTFCANNSFALLESDDPDVITNQNLLYDNSTRFDLSLLGSMSQERKKEMEKTKVLLSCIENYLENATIVKSNKIEIYTRGSSQFNAYVSRHVKDLQSSTKIVAIINDISLSDDDWIFRIDGIQRYRRILAVKLLDGPIAYGKVRRSDKREPALIVGDAYWNDKRLDIDAVENLIVALGKIEDKYERLAERQSTMPPTLNIANSLPALLLEDFSSVTKGSIEKIEKIKKTRTEYCANAVNAAMLIYNAAMKEQGKVVIKGKILKGDFTMYESATINGKTVSLEQISAVSENNKIYQINCTGVEVTDFDSGDYILVEKRQE